MRQAGIIAACGIVALETLVDRIDEDHVLARSIAERLADVDGFGIDPSRVESNMLYVDVSQLGPSTEVVAKLREHGILVSDRPPNHIRIVTHLQITGELAAEAVERCSRAAAALGGTRSAL